MPNKKDNELQQILELLNRLDSDVRATNNSLEETSKRVEKWDERYFQLVRDQGNTARAIIIAAASVVVLGNVANIVIQFIR